LAPFFLLTLDFIKQELSCKIKQRMRAGGMAGAPISEAASFRGKDVSVEEKGTAGFIEFIIRKGVHFTVFALLALSWYGVLRYRLSFAVALPWSAFLSVMTAVFDEWHQTFTPDRTGMVSDVLLDASGSVTMLLIISLIHVYAGRKARNKIGYAQPSYVNKKR
jgi:hypothetical protein